MSFIGGQPQQKLSYSQIYQLALNAGFPPDKAARATAIAMAESAGIPNNFNPNDSHGGSVGLMQINGANAHLIGGQNWTNAGTDPVASMKAAYVLSRGGQDFTPWGAYTNGSYKKFATPAVASAEPGIGSGYPTPAQPNPTAVAAETPPQPPYGGALGQALVALNKGSGADEKSKSVLDQAKDMFPEMKPPESGGAQIPQAPPLQREAPGASALMAQILAQSAKPLSWTAASPGTMMGAGAGGAAGTASPQAAWQQMMLQRQMAGGSGTPGTTLNTTGDQSYG